MPRLETPPASLAIALLVVLVLVAPLAPLVSLAQVTPLVGSVDGRLATGNGTDAVTANHTAVAPNATVAIDVPGRLLVGPDATISLPVTTTLRPGAELSVRIRGPTGRYVPPERTVTVNGSGRATARIDPSNVPPGDRFSVVLSRDGRVLGEFDAQVATGVVDFRDRRVADDASAIEVDAVGTSVGGFVALHRNGTDGPIIGTSDYLAPGDYVDLRVPLGESLDGNATLVAVVHWDADGDGEFDADDRRFGTSLPGHRSGGAAVTDAANLTPVEDPSTVTATPTADAAATATPSSPPGPAATRSPPSSASPPRRTATRSDQSGVPGFGLLAALVAVLAGALGQRRR